MLARPQLLPPARDSSRHYSFTLLLPFLHHFSLQLHVGVLVKHRLLGMTGGREPSILYCHSEGAAFSAATEESPSQAPLTIGINWFLVLIFSPPPYVGVTDDQFPLPEIPRGTILSPCCYRFCIIFLCSFMLAFLLNTACSE